MHSILSIWQLAVSTLLEGFRGSHFVLFKFVVQLKSVNVS